MSGFVRDTEDELAALVPKLVHLDRRACRRRVETRSSAAAMTDGYEAVYRRLATTHAGSQFAIPMPDIRTDELIAGTNLAM